MGSVHCATMCGGLMLSAAPTLRHQLYYHGFRLLGYMTLGAIAGQIGAITFKDNFPPALELGLALLLFGFLIFSAISLILKNHMPEFRSKALSRLAQKGIRFGYSQKSGIQASLVGFFSAILPCGWLYTYVAIAATSRSAGIGTLILVAFWLGTLPALLGGRVLIQAFAAKLGKSATRGVAFTFLIIGFFSLFERVYALSHSANPNLWFCR